MLDWKYGYDVRPDTIEVWNPTASIQFAEAYWECWLERGDHVGATGGSDSHWLSTAAVQGVGNPDHLGVRARPHARRDRRGDRERAARRSRACRRARAARRSLLEADGDGNGAFESGVGDTVPPGARMRVSAAACRRRHRARARERRDPAGAAGHARASRWSSRRRTSGGWVRASLLLPAGRGREAGSRAASPTALPVSTCAYDQLVAGLTSPIYLGG